MRKFVEPTGCDRTPVLIGLPLLIFPDHSRQSFSVLLLNEFEWCAWEVNRGDEQQHRYGSHRLGRGVAARSGAVSWIGRSPTRRGLSGCRARGSPAASAPGVDAVRGSPVTLVSRRLPPHRYRLGTSGHQLFALDGCLPHPNGAHAHRPALLGGCGCCRRSGRRSGPVVVQAPCQRSLPPPTWGLRGATDRVRPNPDLA